MGLIIRLLYQLGVESYEMVDITQDGCFQVFVNGFSIGIHSNKDFLLNQIRYLRRKGKIS